MSDRFAVDVADLDAVSGETHRQEIIEQSESLDCADGWARDCDPGTGHPPFGVLVYEVHGHAEVTQAHCSRHAANPAPYDQRRQIVQILLPRSDFPPADRAYEIFDRLAHAAVTGSLGS